MFETTEETFDGFYRQLQAKIRDKLLATDDDKIADGNIEELTEELLGQYALPLVTIDNSREIEKKYRTTTELVPAHKRERIYQGNGDIKWEHDYLKIMVPINNADTLRECRNLRTSKFSFSWSPSQFNIEDGYLTYEFCVKGYRIPHNEETTIKRYKAIKTNMIEWVGWVSEDIKKGNEELKNWLRTAIQTRKKEIDENRDRKDNLMSKLD